MAPRNHNLRIWTWALAGTLLLLLPAGSAGAQSGLDLDLRAGVYSDTSESFVGAGFLGQVGNTRWFYNPNLEWVFVDRGDLFTVNVDFHYDVTSRGETDFWVGGGPAVIVRKPERRDGETDFGINLLAGIGFLSRHEVRPYIQGKLLFSDDTEAVLAFGIRLF